MGKILMPLQIAAHAQRLAAHPHHSAWVAASAGSGKTKVLTDRVLNLLLEGCPPERILCLTFTKAAAAEMANRVRARLGEWAICPEEDLQQSLHNLLGEDPSFEKMSHARKLFGLTLDTPGGLKILTIHSFCQSLLKRFPLEAELSPFFEVADDTKRQVLIKEASHQVMDNLHDLVLRFSESTLEELTTFILQSRVSFEGLLPEKIEQVFQTKGLSETGLLNSLLDSIPEAKLRESLPLFEEGTATDQTRGQALAQFLSLTHEERTRQYADYLSLFLTLQGEKRACLLTQKVSLKYPDLKEMLEEEGMRLEKWVENHNALDIAKVSQLFLTYGQAFLKTYENLKKERSLLDYEDLILKTVALLKNPGCHWVLYKLDGGLDHILVDEAQDTSPTQWAVIRAIAEEFYANAATDPRNRTLFIVGDDKQSIYSFQGADPAVFSQMQTDLRAFAHQSEKTWQDIDLNVSFRSTPEVLRVVDAVFSSPLSHVPFRKESPGHVEFWPLIKKQEEESIEPWQTPRVQYAQDLPQNRLAKLIAQTIQGWLLHKGPLAKPVRPGDILVLVRRRTAFVDALIRSLKEHNVPVAGIDRLWLLEGIGVQDLLKLAEFLLLPEDDLTLATVLKGPLFTFSEDDLFTLAYGREKMSLWQRLQKQDGFEAVTDLLKDLLSRVDYFTPFALFSHILGPLEGRKKWQARLGPECLDSLDEFLNLCLSFQEKKTPSLQGFLHWISQEVIELKRDLEQSNQVRVMTVHGSKGLQAPIVFLPDTTQPPLDLPPFEIQDKALIWLPPSAKDIPLTKMLKQTLRAQQQEEYRRLLYVALTRAEDALYICGWEGSNAHETWYNMVQQGLQKVGEEIIFDTPCLEGIGWRHSCPQEQVHLPLKPLDPTSFPLPHWLKTLALAEETPHLLKPSQDEEETSFGHSSFGAFATQRGILIHRLLETLPIVPVETQQKAALRFLEKEGISEDRALEMIQCVQRVFKAYPDLFEANSQAEVPIMGRIGDALLSGQIDRLVLRQDHILIIDFKTHTAVPEELKDIPQTYLKQMALYRTALSQIYPQKPILCGLLWTQSPRLDFIPEALMEKQIRLSYEGAKADKRVK
jgi:ATP-dependent helicase/nuclease subunit A